MRVIVAAAMLVLCLVPALARPGDTSLSAGFGGGLDASSYPTKGGFDFGPALAGFIAWNGDYPRVYRLSAQWAQLDYEPQCFHPDVRYARAPSCGTKTIDFKTVHASILWFERMGSHVERYGGAGVGYLGTRWANGATEHGFILSATYGLRFKAGRSFLAIESGGQMVLGDKDFVVVPIRSFLELW
jgi:hypothetical protein